MTTLEQAARQALEALEDYRYRGAPFACIPAINALQQALEQPKQEPVRWMYDWKNDGLTVTDWVTSDKDEAYSPTKGHFNIRPLYTEPPKPQWQEIECPCCGDLARAFPPAPVREWIGLTQEEILAIGKELGMKCRLGGNPNIDLDYAAAIEAALKEKNSV